MLDKLKYAMICLISLTFISTLTSGVLLSSVEEGTGVNSILVIIVFLLCMYLLIKKHPIIAVVVEIVFCLITKAMSGGSESLSSISNIIAYIIAGGIVLFAIQGVVFKSNNRSTLEGSAYEDDDYYDSTSKGVSHSEYKTSSYRKEQPKLINGSKEYWAYKEAAERIYWDFCDTNNSDERRFHKRRAEGLKAQMISEYGINDTWTNYIIDTFLDLRV